MKKPEVGDVLMLQAGRRYTLVELDAPAGDWWFKARAADGRSTLEGNLRLAWDEAARVWRPDPRRERRSVTRRPAALTRAATDRTRLTG